MKITKNGNKFIIELEGNDTPVASKSGKSVVLASTHGNVAIALPDGTQAMVGINIYSRV